MRMWLWGGVIVLLLAVGWWLGSPLFLDRETNEALPVPAAANPPVALPAAESPAPPSSTNHAGSEQPQQPSPPAEEQPKVLYSGTFVDGDANHHASGEAQILAVGGKTYLRFESFRTTNGPDLFVYLAKPGTKTRDGIQLARLKGNVGSQNYELPAELDPADYNRVVIYCRAFHVDFGFAELTRVSM